MHCLARRAAENQAIRTAEVAKEEGIPEKFLEAILLDLRKASLLRSQRGPEGGHRLARSPAEISLGDIWRAMDGPLSPGRWTGCHAHAEPARRLLEARVGGGGRGCKPGGGQDHAGGALPPCG